MRSSVALVRATCEEVGRQVALMMDIKGPEIRTGAREGSIDIVAGDSVVFHEAKSEFASVEGVIPIEINYPWLHEDLKPGCTVVVDSGLLRFVVEKIEGGNVWCRTEVGGRLGSRRHINLPGIHVRLPSLTDKDLSLIHI